MSLAAESARAETPPSLAPYSLWPKGHVERVARYAELLAAAAGLDDDTIATIRTAALLHEIGKLSIPDEILRKPGALTPEEYEQIKRHTVLGAEMCRDLRDGGAISAIVRSHHEHWDGTGYPDGLARDAIPVGARIVAVADAYDTLTIDRPFRRAFAPEDALEILWFGADTQWDPRMVDLFDTMLRSLLVLNASV